MEPKKKWRMSFKKVMSQNHDDIEREKGRPTLLSENINANASTYKQGRTIWINAVLAAKLKDEGINASRFFDKLGSEYFGITYAEAFGRKAIRQGNEERLWDLDGKYRQKDIEEGTDRLNKKRSRR